MKKAIKIINVVGARPNFMKVAPLIKKMRLFPGRIDPVLVHTGQHYDYRMSRVFFRDLDLPKPDIHLEVGSGNHGEQTGRILIKFEKVLQKYKPDMVLVVGDVNSTVACALASVKLNIPVAHVEAGLRSFDMSMPEEVNRIVTDRISTYLFTPCQEANNNLLREGIENNRIFLVGNVMVDSLMEGIKKAASMKIADKLGLEKKGYILVTAHRPSAVDNKSRLLGLINGLSRLSKRIPVVFPMHPRTKKNIAKFGLRKYFVAAGEVSGGGKHKIIYLDPMGYLSFLSLMSSASFVVTDSGGIQEETTILNIPCITIRENTERPITITEGTNVLAGLSRDKLLSLAYSIMNGKFKRAAAPRFWDGKTAHRIVKKIIDKEFS
ncbi:MAG: UDP-N-acetylglucosamine 2-epimerase (non-hydrolyzing) [Candidatus Omnitrophota bacterium]|jgi:UDP-N-acetylglucosamine 2-epimerase (non-hydrolysing)